MNDGGQSPDELETLMEDAFVLQDWDALARLFTRSGVLVAGDRAANAGRPAEFALAAREAARAQGTFVAGGRRIVQSKNMALLVGDGAIHVAKRGRDQVWRFAISILGPAVRRG